MPTLTDQRHVDYMCNKLFGQHASSLVPISKSLQIRIPMNLQPAAEQKQTHNQLLKLYTVKDLYSSLYPDYLNVVGILKNVQHVNISNRDSRRLPFFARGTGDKADEVISLSKLKSTYIGDLHSTIDSNSIPILLIEDGFSSLTSLLLSTTHNYIIVIQQAKRMLASNLEPYLEVRITSDQIKIIGKYVPMLMEHGWLDITAAGVEEAADRFESLNSISPEIITRNQMNIRVRITDINFIKFEFVCVLCNGGTLLSTAKCINKCQQPRPAMKIFIRITV